MSVESRLKKIEDTVGIAAVPKDPEEMWRAFCRGEYGNVADLFRLIIAGVHIDPGKSGFPEEIIKQLLSRVGKSHNPIAG